MHTHAHAHYIQAYTVEHFSRYESICFTLQTFELGHGKEVKLHLH